MVHLGLSRSGSARAGRKLGSGYRCKRGLPGGSFTVWLLSAAPHRMLAFSMDFITRSVASSDERQWKWAQSVIDR